MSEYTRFVSKANETLKNNNMKPKNIISFIREYSLWDGNYNDSVKKLSNHLRQIHLKDYQGLLKKSEIAKEGMRKSNESVANAERRIQEKRLQEMELDLLADLNKENQKKLSNRGKYKITDPSIVSENTMNEYLSIPTAPPIAPIAPDLVRLLDKKKKKKQSDDDGEECPHCDCPFGEYNKCKGDKDRPDDYMFEKTKDGKKVDLGKTIINVYCGATNGTSVPRELANTALEINSAPPSVKQRVAEQLGETIKSLDTKAPSKKWEPVQIVAKKTKDALTSEQKEELRILAEKQAQADLKKAKDKTGNLIAPPSKVVISDDVRTALMGLLGTRATAIAKQKEKEEEKKAQALPVLPDVPPPIPSGSGYYRKKRKTRKLKK
jgi:hypothetical protein